MIRAVALAVAPKPQHPQQAAQDVLIRHAMLAASYSTHWPYDFAAHLPPGVIPAPYRPAKFHYWKGRGPR